MYEESSREFKESIDFTESGNSHNIFNRSLFALLGSLGAFQKFQIISRSSEGRTTLHSSGGRWALASLIAFTWVWHTSLLWCTTALCNSISGEVH